MLRLCARPVSGTRAPLSKTAQKELGQTETLPVVPLSWALQNARFRAYGAGIRKNPTA